MGLRSRPRNGLTVLVVDDDDDVRWIVAEALQDFGYTVEQASSGEEALPLLSGGCHIDALVTDVRMPGMSGFELADHVERHRPEIKIVVMSGYFQPQAVRQRFLRKPFHIQDLASAILESFGRRRRTKVLEERTRGVQASVYGDLGSWLMQDAAL